jgi:hypothetical protein
VVGLMTVPGAREVVVAELAQGHGSVRQPLRGDEPSPVGPRDDTADIAQLLRAPMGGNIDR